MESSAEQLYQSAVKAFPNTTMRQHATHPVVIRELRWTPFVGVKTLFIKGLAQNEEREYTPCVLFKGVNYNGDDVKIIASDGLRYDFEKLSLENTDVLLRCNCPDFRYRFSWYNHLDKSLYGSTPKKYHSKGIGHPANPMQLEGMCKHLMKTIKVLKEAGIFLD
jgi:hypothetical protein